MFNIPSLPSIRLYFINISGWLSFCNGYRYGNRTIFGYRIHKATSRNFDRLLFNDESWSNTRILYVTLRHRLRSGYNWKHGKGQGLVLSTVRGLKDSHVLFNLLMSTGAMHS